MNAKKDNLLAQAPRPREIYDKALEVVMPAAVQHGEIGNRDIQEMMRDHFLRAGTPSAVLDALEPSGRHKFKNNVAFAIVGLQGRNTTLPRDGLLNLVNERNVEGENRKTYKPTPVARVRFMGRKRTQSTKLNSLALSILMMLKTVARKLSRPYSADADNEILGTT